MNEKSKLELVGKEKEEILEKVKERMNSWGLKLPKVYACPFHFGLKNYSEIGALEFDINNNIEEGYCGKLIFMFKDQTCPLHYHKLKHETFFVIKGKVELEADSKKTILNQGDIYIMDRNVTHKFSGLEDSLILESSKPDLLDDSIFENNKINEIINSFL